MRAVWPLDPDMSRETLTGRPVSHGVPVNAGFGSRARWVAEARHWLAFIGPARLAAGTVSLFAVAAGGWLLVRAPAPPVESLMPRATPVPTPVSTGPAIVVVHVAGAVARPGVYTLPAGSRVVDAVAAAGGAVRGADLAALNLAVVLVDTEQVFVPLLGRDGSRALVAPRLRPGAGAGSAGTGSAGPTAKVNLNTATADQLDALPGVGPATAASIVDHRTRHGPFASVDDLLDVPGIGEAKLAALRDLVTV
jgi:competence protein ComEA